MVVTAFFVSTSCSNVASDQPALVHVRELQAKFIGEASCGDTSGTTLGCGVQIHPAPGEENAPVSSMTLGDWRFSYNYTRDRSLVGWNFLKEWAESVGCTGFGEWVLAKNTQTLRESCDPASQSLAIRSSDAVAIFGPDHHCPGVVRQNGICGVDIKESLIRYEPLDTIDMATVFFSYRRQNDVLVDQRYFGSSFLRDWAAFVGCDNALDDWVYDFSTIEAMSVPCSGDINEGWVAREGSFSDCFSDLPRRAAGYSSGTLCAVGNLKSGRLSVEFDYTENRITESSASWLGTFSCRNPRQGSINRLRGDWTESQISAWAYGASSRVLEWC